MYSDYKILFSSNIMDVCSYAELKEAIAQGKWARGPWSARLAIFLSIEVSFPFGTFCEVLVNVTRA